MSPAIETDGIHAGAGLAESSEHRREIICMCPSGSEHKQKRKERAATHRQDTNVGIEVPIPATYTGTRLQPAIAALHSHPHPATAMRIPTDDTHNQDAGTSTGERNPHTVCRYLQSRTNVLAPGSMCLDISGRMPPMGHGEPHSP